jgi:hypothetical protein|tara:strand:- start:435 stop:647 length:213 start_codon:yes stop_codon:yes gene_type:complete
MNDLENINKLKKSRNIWLIVAVVAGFGAALRWFGVYGAGPGTISWLTIVMSIVAIFVVISKHIKLSNLNN